MLGAIAGDIIGSLYEHNPIKTTAFPLFQPYSRFTDDTVLTIAVADALLHDGDYSKSLEDYYYRYPSVPYGARFHHWARGHEHEPYNSWGNGSAMRVSPVAYVHSDVEAVLQEAKFPRVVNDNYISLGRIIVVDEAKRGTDGLAVISHDSKVPKGPNMFSRFWVITFMLFTIGIFLATFFLYAASLEEPLGRMKLILGAVGGSLFVGSGVLATLFFARWAVFRLEERNR